MNPIILGYIIVILTPMFALSQPALEISAPQFTNIDPIVSDAGNAKISWTVASDESLPPDVAFQLQQSSEMGFSLSKTRYLGPDLSSFVSGLPNGTYYWRVRIVDNAQQPLSQWSKPLTLEVEHHSLDLALALFFLGGIVFIATAAVVIIGAIKTSGAGEHLG